MAGLSPLARPGSLRGALLARGMGAERGLTRKCCAYAHRGRPLPAAGESPRAEARE